MYKACIKCVATGILSLVQCILSERYEGRNALEHVFMKVCYRNKQYSQSTRCEISQFIYSCKTLYMFQTVFPSIIRRSKLRIQRQVFFRLILLPAASGR